MNLTGNLERTRTARVVNDEKSKSEKKYYVVT